MSALDWLSGEGPRTEVVLSTRVRLARNLERYPFPSRGHAPSLAEVFELVGSKLLTAADSLGLSGPMTYLDVTRIHPLELQLLVERHLASPAFASSPLPRGLGLTEDGTLSLMVNEEDHLRVQCLLSGLQLEEAWRQAAQLETFLAQSLDFAYDSQFGFLTACPSNIGTGLRASAMVHLPGLAWLKALEPITQQIAQLGLTVRGVYGEGSCCTGHLLQISNQVTLGLNEEDILTKLHAVCEQLVHYETSARQQLQESQKLAMEDQVWRSYALLRNARLMESAEVMEHLSMVRLGVHLGLLPPISVGTLNSLMVRTRPANLQVEAGRELKPAERDAMRAEVIRKLLQSDNRPAPG